MNEHTVDEYADQFLIHTTAYGVAITFSRSDHKPPPSVGRGGEPTDVATVRMSLEHLKAMAFILVRQVKEVEREYNLNIQLPTQVLNSLRVAPEDWESFWASE